MDGTRKKRATRAVGVFCQRQAPDWIYRESVKLAQKKKLPLFVF